MMRIVDCVHLIYNFVHFIMNSGRDVLGCLEGAIEGLGGPVVGMLWGFCVNSVAILLYILYSFALNSLCVTLVLS